MLSVLSDCMVDINTVKRLLNLISSGDFNVTMLSRFMNMNYSHVFNVLSVLEKRGLVSKQKHGRVCRVLITDDGVILRNVLNARDFHVNGKILRKLRDIYVKGKFTSRDLGYKLLRELRNEGIVEKVDGRYYVIRDRGFFDTYVAVINKYLSDII